MSKMVPEAITLCAPNKALKGRVQLVASKSVSNRALILATMSAGKVSVHNLSDASDTTILQETLQTKLQDGPSKIIDVGASGTAMRFLTAYLSLQHPMAVSITGTKRMRQRPIAVLVQALQDLGAHIMYEDQLGFPPLKILGGFRQKRTAITVSGSISSQYISALLLIAPKLPLGLQLHIQDDIISSPYVAMTLSMLQQVGITHTWQDQTIHIHHQAFQNSQLIIESDWTAASYWYAMAALSEEALLFLPDLTTHSLQGDRIITALMTDFGVSSQFKDGGVYLQKKPPVLIRKTFDCTAYPDLAQTLIVCCAALGHEAFFIGLETLKFKETNRIEALQKELAKIGVFLTEKAGGYQLDCTQCTLPERVFIDTYEDHRMAMAFAPLALLIPEVCIANHQVVNKSYPNFWQDMKMVGFVLGK